MIKYLLILAILTSCSQEQKIPTSWEHMDAKATSSACFDRCLGFAYENDGNTKIFDSCYCHVICHFDNTMFNYPRHVCGEKAIEQIDECVPPEWDESRYGIDYQVFHDHLFEIDCSNKRYE